jgi:ferredoxin
MTDVQVDRERCIGSGNCVHFAPGAFALDDEGLSTVVDADGAPLEQVEAAARQCPTEAIAVRP